MRFPPALRPGDPIGVVAPSGPFDQARLEAGLQRLEKYEVRIPEQMMGRREGFFAGSETTRLSELQAALDNPEIKAICIARGGYGIGPLLPSLSFSQFEKHPKWLVGFSDTTALHAALSARGIASIHGANGTTLSSLSDVELREMLNMLSGGAPDAHEGLESLCPGSAEGPLCGGNLTVLFAEAAAGRLQLPEGGVLFLEDVMETSYRVDRMLSSLTDGGYLKRLSGVVFGEFTDCSSGRFDVPTAEVLASRARAWGIPVASGLASGHGARNRPLLLGATVCLDATSGRLHFS